MPRQARLDAAGTLLFCYVLETTVDVIFGQLPRLTGYPDAEDERDREGDDDGGDILQQPYP